MAVFKCKMCGGDLSITETDKLLNEKQLTAKMMFTGIQ